MVLAVLVAAAIAVSVYAFVATRREAGYPRRWDARVSSLARYVERERGLEFKHPVEVEFLTAKEYSERVRAEEADLTGDDRDDLEHTAAVLRALGLAEGDLDLFGAGNDLADAGTLAFYDPEAEQVYVRGENLTVDLRATIVHELAHALQDQHFDLNRELDTSGEEFAFRALYEGDAARTEAAYVSSLDENEQQQYEQASIGQRSESASGLVDVPDALVAFFGAGYALGEPFAEILATDGGNRGLDDAFRNPPTSEEHLLDPSRYLTGDEPMTVDAPNAPNGADVIEEGNFGAVSLLFVLAERIDAFDALDAADGWGGDAYSFYEKDGRACVRLAVQGDTNADTERLGAALQAWANGLPAVRPTVRHDGDLVRVQACDPGADADLDVGGRGADALSIASARSYLQARALEGGHPVPKARCLGHDFVHRFTVAELGAADVPPDYADRLNASLAACGLS